MHSATEGCFQASGLPLMRDSGIGSQKLPVLGYAIVGG
jgi:hypothetical protein